MDPLAQARTWRLIAVALSIPWAGMTLVLGVSFLRALTGDVIALADLAVMGLAALGIFLKGVLGGAACATVLASALASREHRQQFTVLGWWAIAATLGWSAILAGVLTALTLAGPP